MTLEIEAHDDREAVESGYDLQRLLAKLPGTMQQAIRQVKIEGLSVAEAAVRSDMSESAVKVSIHRGLKKLADMIADEVKS
jgi:RNA polymerase sigma-70 factor (ECF subfamily)